MKAVNRVISITLAFFLVVLTFSTAVLSEKSYYEGLKVSAEISLSANEELTENSEIFESGNFQYVLVDGYASICKCSDGVSGRVEVPERIDGYYVVSIDDSAFEGCSLITEIILPETVVSIGNRAFYGCERLTKINIIDGLLSIGDDAFFGCPNIVISNLSTDDLKSVIIDANRIANTDSSNILSEETSLDEDGDATEESVISMFTIDVVVEEHYASSTSESDYVWKVDYSEELIDTVIKGILSFNGSFSIAKYNITTSQIESLLDAVQREYPVEYVAAGISSYTYSYYPSSGIVASLGVKHSSSSIASEYEERYNKLSNIVVESNESMYGMSTIEKIVFVHDELILTSAYDTNFEHYAAYDLIVNGTGVCQSYAYAFKMYMDLFDIPCIVVASDEMNHAWNMVMLDDDWYHIDVTWDDPLPDRAGTAQYKYLLLTNEEITNKEHYGWEPNVSTSSVEYSNMPRTDSDTQYLHEGRWYFYDDKSGSINSCDIYGGDIKSICSPASGGISIYNDKIYFGNGSSINSYDLNSAETSTIYTLSESEKSKSEGSLGIKISSISIDDDGILSYKHNIWTFYKVEGNSTYYTSSVVEGENTIDVFELPDEIIEFYALLDPLTETVSSQKEADLAEEMLAVYESLTSKNKSYIDNERLAKIDKIKINYEKYLLKPATAIILDKTTVTLNVDECDLLTATVVPADSTDSVVWKSSDVSIATVENGNVTAVGAGTATITATAGEFSASCTVIVSEPHIDYDVTPNINGGASKLYEPWGLRYFAAYNGNDIDKIKDRGIVILKDKYYTSDMTAEQFASHENAFVYLDSKGELGFEEVSANNINGRYYATLTEGIYSYDISSYYYVVPFAVMENGETIYGTIKKNSMEKILNTNLNLTSISETEKAICVCILDLKDSVAAHYAASGVPGASLDINIPRGDSQTAAGSVKSVDSVGVAPNVVAGASRLIEPWGLRFFAKFDGENSGNIRDRGMVILCEKYYDSSYASDQDAMRLNANAYVFNESNNTLAYDSVGARYYATVTEGISSKDIADVYYVVPFVVLNDGSYVYGTVKNNSMLKIMNTNLGIASIPETEKNVTRDIIDLYEAVKAYYA